MQMIQLYIKAVKSTKKILAQNNSKRFRICKKRLLQLRNGQSRLILYSALVKQNLFYLQQRKCRHGINSKTNNFRLAAIASNQKE